MMDMILMVWTEMICGVMIILRIDIIILPILVDYYYKYIEYECLIKFF